MNTNTKFNILATSGEDVAGKVLFALTKSPNICKMSDAVGEKFTVKAWVIYEDEDKKDREKVNTILSILDEGGTIRATNSQTFREMFVDITQIMGNTGFEISVVNGTSKAGREFITCDLPL